MKVPGDHQQFLQIVSALRAGILVLRNARYGDGENQNQKGFPWLGFHHVLQNLRAQIVACFVCGIHYRRPFPIIEKSAEWLDSCYFSNVRK